MNQSFPLHLSIPLLMLFLAWLFLLTLIHVFQTKIPVIRVYYGAILIQSKNISKSMNTIIKSFHSPKIHSFTTKFRSFIPLILVSEFFLALIFLFKQIIAFLFFHKTSIQFMNFTTSKTYGFFAWLIIITMFLLVLFLHEIGHAIMLSPQTMKLVSWVIMIFFFSISIILIIPQKANQVLSQRQRFFATSGAILLHTFFLFLLLPLALYPAFFQTLVFSEPQGVLITHVQSQSIAEASGIKTGMIIIGVRHENSTIDIKNTHQLENYLNSCLSKQNAITFIMKNQNTYTIPCLFMYDKPPTLGIQVFNYYATFIDDTGFLAYYITLSISWFFWFHLTLLVVNLFPLWITDGDYLFQYLLQQVIPKNMKIQRILLNFVRFTLTVTLSILLIF